MEKDENRVGVAQSTVARVSLGGKRWVVVQPDSNRVVVVQSIGWDVRGSQKKNEYEVRGRYEDDDPTNAMLATRRDLLGCRVRLTR